MPYFLKLLSVFLLATVKYFYTPLYGYLTGLSFVETSVTMVSGGIFSFFFFYYLSYFVLLSTNYFKPAAHKVIPNDWLTRYYERKRKKALKSKPKKIFTRRNRMIIKLRRVGVWAIILLTPVTLSIPLGAFLLRRYYRAKTGIIFFAILAISIEGVFFCWCVWNFPDLRP